MKLNCTANFNSTKSWRRSPVKKLSFVIYFKQWKMFQWKFNENFHYTELNKRIKAQLAAMMLWHFEKGRKLNSIWWKITSLPGSETIAVLQATMMAFENLFLTTRIPFFLTGSYMVCVHNAAPVLENRKRQCRTCSFSVHNQGNGKGNPSEERIIDTMIFLFESAGLDNQRMLPNQRPITVFSWDVQTNSFKIYCRNREEN